MNLTPWAWLILPLGVTRAMQLVLHDRLLDRPRGWLLRRLNPEGRTMNDPDRGYLSYLIECPWCLSVWLGGAAVALVAWDTTRAGALLVLAGLSLSEAAVAIDRTFDRLWPDEPTPPPVPSSGDGAPPGVEAALASMTGDDPFGGS